ncbi:MAG TPA: PEGA domain-containing protein [Candidatus Saccharimonadales bacterium]|nr:PEGA domain-containing protein [Candidatus Saccharimonadales bacterium]
MDYLDSRKRRAHNIRLVIGYVLVAIVIGLATVIIVYGANGYGINTKTGQIVQNGLLFVDSNPSGAEIFINGADRNATSAARLIIPGGKYTLTLKKDGYRDWSRSFTLNGGSVARYVYPMLFPVKPVITNLKTYTAAPELITQSPNQQWLLVEDVQKSAKTPTFDVYDTSTLDSQTPKVTQVGIPDGLLTDYPAQPKLKEVEWSTDNSNVLLEHILKSGSEFIVFNRAHPEQSISVSKLFKLNPSQVSLFNKKADQLYLYFKNDGTLRLGDTGVGTVGSPILSGVLAYKPYGKNLITYVTAAGEPAGKADARIWDSGQTYSLYEFSAGTNYLIDAAEFQGNFYYIAGSDAADRINIYKNPLDDLSNPAIGKALPLLALHDPGADKVGFSNNARFVGVEAGQRFAVHDFETDSSYEYEIPQPLMQEMSWMDGHRLIAESAGQVLVMDYDGTNSQLVTATNLPAGGFFNSDYHHLLTTVGDAKKAGVILQDVDMRAGSDLPKNKQPSS